jgi:hypothetical protein
MNDMKKLSILTVLLVFVMSSFAQEFKTTTKKEISPDHIAVYDNTDSEGTVAPYSKVGGVVIGGAQNIYTALLDGPHQVMYNSEINTIVFVHRALDEGGGDSGELAFDFSTDEGETWTTECWISNTAETANAEARYPSITIYNEPGNTDLANARVVANGPALIGYGASLGWGYEFEIDATIEANPTTNEFFGSNTGTNNDFHPYSLTVGPDGTIWSISTNYSAGDEDILNSYNYYINKGVYNEGTDKIDWTSPLHTITPDFYYNDGTDRFSGWGHDIAVDPNDGDIVYAMVNCQEVADWDAGTRSTTPHIWKSTDGGTSWTQQALLDYTPFETELEGLIYYDSDAGDDMNPKATGVDMTVDADGVLHCFVTLGSDAQDWASHYGLWVYEEGNPNGIPTRHYVDFTLDGSTWDMEYIAPVLCEDAVWADVATYEHPQVGRTEAGDQIVYAWQETLFDADSLNTAPNLMVARKNVTTGEMIPPYNATDDSGAEGICYFSQISPIIIDNGDGVGDAERYEIPTVISLIDFAEGTDLDPVNFLYLYDLYAPSSVSVDQVSGPEVLIYPNPVADKVFVGANATVELYNMLGARLLSVKGQDEKTIVEMSQFPAGTYVLKIYSDEGIVTKKIQKVN